MCVCACVCVSVCVHVCMYVNMILRVCIVYEYENVDEHKSGHVRVCACQC